MQSVLLDALASANELQPSYSAVLPQHVWLVPSGSLPRTVKGTIQRKPVEKMLLANSLPDGAVKLEGDGFDSMAMAVASGARAEQVVPLHMYAIVAVGVLYIRHWSKLMPAHTFQMPPEAPLMNSVMK